MSKQKNKKSKIDYSSKPKKSRIKTSYKIAAVIIVFAFTAYIFITNYSVTENGTPEEYVFTKEGELSFYNDENEFIKKIDIEIAESDYERQLGLMYRTEMTENQGMLFIFPYQTYQSFWMRNTKISLDMMFINEKRNIVTIHKNTTPLSDQSYPSTEPAKYVVEVIAGFTDKFKIETGDQIRWMTTKINL